MSEAVAVTLDINKLISAYDKEKFMKEVFIEFLKANPSVVANALGTYVLMDLVKSNQIEPISESVKIAIGKHLEEIQNASIYGSPIKSAINDVIKQSVVDNKKLIEQKVVSHISSEFTKEAFINQMTSFVHNRLVHVLGDIEGEQ